MPKPCSIVVCRLPGGATNPTVTHRLDVTCASYEAYNIAGHSCVLQGTERCVVVVPSTTEDFSIVWAVINSLFLGQTFSAIPRVIRPLPTTPAAPIPTASVSTTVIPPMVSSASTASATSGSSVTTAGQTDGVPPATLNATLLVKGYETRSQLVFTMSEPEVEFVELSFLARVMVGMIAAWPVYQFSDLHPETRAAEAHRQTAVLFYETKLHGEFSAGETLVFAVKAQCEEESRSIYNLEICGVDPGTGSTRVRIICRVQRYLPKTSGSH